MRRTGKYAYVDGVPCVAMWSSSQTASLSSYQASCAPGGTVVLEGNIGETGNIKGYGYIPLMPDDDDIPFIGVASAKPTEIVNYEGVVIIYETTLSIPVKSGAAISWTANWGAQGILEKNTTPQHVDPTREPSASGKWGKIAIEGTPDSDTWTDVDAVQDITLTWRRPITETAEDGLIYREAGNLESTISFSVESDNREVALYALNATRRVRVYVTATLFFEFDAIIFGDKSNFVVDRESNQMISYTVNGQWTALRERTPAALGEILLPDGSTYYGNEIS